jgi:predicted Zn-dependent protease
MGRGGMRRGLGGGSLKMRLLIAAVVAVIALAGYFLNTSTNPVTGVAQRVGGLDPTQEVQMGLAAMPEMAAQFGGRSGNAAGQALVERIGNELLAAIPAVYDEHIDSIDDIPWEFSFTLLDDDNTVNAFALPGGPTFVTDALFNRFETEGQLAGVMGHEIGHVLHRHGLERMAKQNLLQGLAGAATTAAGDVSAGQVTAMVGNFLQMSYGREQELQCDREGILLMVEAGYDPRAMIGVMEILSEATGGKGGGQPEWASTHPDPGNRIEKIKQTIDDLFPDGVPEGLKP